MTEEKSASMDYDSLTNKNEEVFSTTCKSVHIRGIYRTPARLELRGAFSPDVESAAADG